MKLGPNTKSYDIWKSPPIPMSLDIYFYNWTNPTNFTADEFKKPKLQELGPYRFTEITDKSRIKWHPENSTVSFRKKSTFFFDEAGSKGSLDDVIASLNIIALVHIRNIIKIKTRRYSKISHTYIVGRNKSSTLAVC